MIEYEWKSGWYASRLHAVPVGTFSPAETNRLAKMALCKAFVYNSPPTEFAAKRVAKGVPHCVHCERRIASMGVAG